MSNLEAIFASYIITAVLTSGHIFNAPRNWLIARTRWLIPPYDFAGEPARHPLVCRLCLGFWVSIVIGYLMHCNIFLVYGASYFLATQER